MKCWVVGAALAALVLPVAGAGAQQAILPPLVISTTDDSGARDLPLTERHDRPAPEAFVPEQVLAEAAAGATLPIWSARVRDGSSGKSFKYMMVGQNPQIPLQNPALRIKVVLVPVVFTFRQGAVFDPTAVDHTCSPTGSALDLTLASPLFTSVSSFPIPDGTDLGAGQFASLFQRANFFQFAGPQGINPDFSLTLRPQVEKKIHIPVTGGFVRAANCGQFGEIDLPTFDKFLRAKVFPMLRTVATPDTFPLFLLYNVVMFTGSPGACCSLGYHSAFANKSAGGNLQTYAVAAYLTSGGFKAADTATLSHEINEWQDDPLATNAVPAWGHTGQVQGCSKVLEVGDPLSGTIFPIEMGNGFTYHVQDLAFFSWFYHQNPSLGVDGQYSLFGTFKTPAPACP